MNEALRNLASHTSPKELATPTENLIDRYHRREPTSLAHQATAKDARAYAISRMPSTYGAIRSALHAVQEILPDFAPNTLLDVGSGPGTAIWAATDAFPSLTHITAIERESAMIDLGQQLAQYAPSSPIKDTTWLSTSLSVDAVARSYDLIIASYVMGELPPKDRLTLIEHIWAHSATLLLIVEPGTPSGFECVRALRMSLLDNGAYVVAPCPHSDTCPIPAHDWCHFATRIARSRLQKQLKGGSAPYEDEKFSYVALSKSAIHNGVARVIRHPRHDPGRVTVRLCDNDGLRNDTITKSTGAAFRIARKLRWGDRFITPTKETPIDPDQIR